MRSSARTLIRAISTVCAIRMPSESWSHSRTPPGSLLPVRPATSSGSSSGCSDAMTALDPVARSLTTGYSDHGKGGDWRSVDRREG